MQICGNWRQVTGCVVDDAVNTPIGLDYKIDSPFHSYRLANIAAHEMPLAPCRRDFGCNPLTLLSATRCNPDTPPAQLTTSDGNSTAGRAVQSEYTTPYHRHSTTLRSPARHTRAQRLSWHSVRHWTRNPATTRTSATDQYAAAPSIPALIYADGGYQAIGLKEVQQSGEGGSLFRLSAIHQGSQTLSGGQRGSIVTAALSMSD